jgi:peptidoglycan/LPS O-acetylase OafA/YrhL
MAAIAIPPRYAHLPYLDGLRGTASAWVFFYHVALVNAVRYPVLREGPSAVDLFMILSGFLMAFHYIEREGREPWGTPRTWIRFWVRRFFRIAPLYYVLLAAALLGGLWIGHARDMIGSVHPEALTVVSRYNDHSMKNWLTHITFVFGFLPRYGYRTALPDWSIGLEMQFYVTLPFLMIAWKRIGPIGLAAAALIASAAICFIFPRYVAAFPMPSMLAMKLHVFVAGMLLAGALHAGWSRRAALLAAAALAMPLVAAVVRVENVWAAMIQMILTAMFACLVFHEALQKLPAVGGVVSMIVTALDSRFMRWLGDTSYSVYLLHLLIVIPVVGLLSTNATFNSLPGRLHFLVSALICAPLVYLLAWGLHRLIEVPGIALGKRTLALWTGRSAPAVTAKKGI